MLNTKYSDCLPVSHKILPFNHGIWHDNGGRLRPVSSEYFAVRETYSPLPCFRVMETIGYGSRRPDFEMIVVQPILGSDSPCAARNIHDEAIIGSYHTKIRHL